MVSRLEELLERIALALEVIAGDPVKGVDIRGKEETPFPWGDTRVGARTSNQLNWKSRKWDRRTDSVVYGESIRPETFEGFIKLGRSVLRAGEAGTRNLGKTSIDRLDAVFEEYGFGDRWMAS